jgi:UDP-N-acetylmuramoyl-L-alanyl-D-glutamate--2,6-diaminopimelate ligase
VAIEGFTTDGHLFIEEAIEKGAVAVVGEKQEQGCRKRGVPFIFVRNSREALAYLSAAFYDYPARKLKVIGVTGTDGKTTTVNLIRSILAASGYKAGMISTVNALIGGEYYDTGLHTTTPDATEVQRYLAKMVEAGADYAVIESTSHGLSQHRLTSCDFDVAVITNITHEHLDYHKTFEQYREAKAILFRNLAKSFRKPNTPKVSVLNVDDSSYEYLRRIEADEHLSYGLRRKADVMAEKVSHSLSGISFVAVTPQGDFDVKTPLIGVYNVYNILASISVGISQGVSFDAMKEGIEAMKGVSGRMERIDVGQDFTAIVDFAHTPNSLENALKSARELTEGRVIVVFGCPGLRDREKRPMMGEISGRLADLIVITADDPRTEDVNDIMQEIAVGCEAAGRREGEDYWRIPDRKEAIAFAIKKALPGDLVMFAGKGHERSICFGTEDYPWNEHEVVREAIELIKGV